MNMAESIPTIAGVQDLLDKPFQPSHFKFPVLSFGNTAPVKFSIVLVFSF